MTRELTLPAAADPAITEALSDGVGLDELGLGTGVRISKPVGQSDGALKYSLEVYNRKTRTTSTIYVSLRDARDTKKRKSYWIGKVANFFLMKDEAEPRTVRVTAYPVKSDADGQTVLDGEIETRSICLLCEGLERRLRSADPTDIACHLRRAHPTGVDRSPEVAEAAKVMVLELILEQMLPADIVNSPTFARFFGGVPVCEEKLSAIVKEVSLRIQRRIAEMVKGLPLTLLFDGVTFTYEEFVATIVVCHRGNFLIKFAIPDGLTIDSAALLAYLRVALGETGIDWGQIVAVEADAASVNGATVRALKLPFVKCGLHILGRVFQVVRGKIPELFGRDGVVHRANELATNHNFNMFRLAHPELAEKGEPVVIGQHVDTRPLSVHAVLNGIKRNKEVIRLAQITTRRVQKGKSVVIKPLIPTRLHLTEDELALVEAVLPAIDVLNNAALRLEIGLDHPGPFGGARYIQQMFCVLTRAPAEFRASAGKMMARPDCSEVALHLGEAAEAVEVGLVQRLASMRPDGAPTSCSKPRSSTRHSTSRRTRPLRFEVTSRELALSWRR
jgi:hypothetical protein